MPRPTYASVTCTGFASSSCTSSLRFVPTGRVLSDAYYPTIESSNVKTLQYIVTDGKTFADLQERDMTYTVSQRPEDRLDRVHQREGGRLG